MLTVKEVAERLKIGEKTVRGWLRAGKLKGSKLPNGDWRVREMDVERLLEAGMHHS